MHYTIKSKRTFAILSLSLLFLIFVPDDVLARNDISDTVNIGEVIIHENRMELPVSQKPSGVVVVSSDKIENMPVESVSGLLQYISGVDIRQRGSSGIQGDIGIRGSSFDQVLILINGIKMNDPQTGHHSMNIPLDISNIDHIEIYKGSSARVFGQNAFAGAVNIITKSPEDDFVKLQLEAGDFSLYGANVAVSLGSNKMRNYLSFNHDRSSGYRYNTDYKISDVFYQSDITSTAGNVSLLGGFVDRRFGANGFYASPVDSNSYEAVQTSLVSIDYKPAINNKNFILNNRIYWRRNQDEYILRRENPSYYRNLHRNNVAGVDFNLSYRNKLGVTGLGLDINTSWITSNRLGNRNRQEATLFIEHRLELFNGNMIIDPGVQVNIFSDFENNILPGIDLGYYLTPSFMLFANSGLTYRVPTFTDLYYQDPYNGSNPYLEPEYAFSNEAGIKTVNTKGVTAQLSYFIRQNRDLIDRTKENDSALWIPDNIGKVVMSGVDMNVNIKPWEIASNRDFIVQQVDLDYTYIHSEIDGKLPEFSRFALDNIKNQFSAGIVLRYIKNVYHSINTRYVDRLNMDDYVVTDTRLSWQSRQFSVYLNITNIFNTEYIETNLVPMPGRWFKVGASFKFELK